MPLKRALTRGLTRSVVGGLVSGVTILDIVAGDTFTVEFSGSVSVDEEFNGNDTGLVIDGNGVQNVSQVDATHIALTMSIPDYVSDVAWSLTAQPAWLLTVAVLPQSGTTS